MKKTKYARVGEQVRLVNVKRFVRCGYPLTRDMVAEKFKEEIAGLLFKCVSIIRGIPPAGIKFVDPAGLGDKLADSKLEDAICFYILNREGFGGRERQVFEEDISVDSFEYLYVHPGSDGVVKAKKIVYTGTHYGPSGGYSSYDGEYDYEPGGLDKARAHCVYTLDIKGCEFQTLAVNCERI